MRIYLAAPYSQKEDIHIKAQELKDLKFKITSSWFTELGEVPEKELIKTAYRDMHEIHRSDILALFTLDPTTPFVRGGRHWEMGFAYGLGKECIIIGPRENIFHYLSTIQVCPTWEEAKQYLLEQKKLKYGNK